MKQILLLTTTIVLSVSAQFFTSFPSAPPENFTQEVFAIGQGTIWVGVAFVGPNVIVTNCDSPYASFLSPNADATFAGNSYHSGQILTFPRSGCNLINHPDGYLYYATPSGIVRLDPQNSYHLVREKFW